jgi:hypothetical protein
MMRKVFIFSLMALFSLAAGEALASTGHSGHHGVSPFQGLHAEGGHLCPLHSNPGLEKEYCPHLKTPAGKNPVLRGECGGHPAGTLPNQTQLSKEFPWPSQAGRLPVLPCVNVFSQNLLFKPANASPPASPPPKY